MLIEIEGVWINPANVAYVRPDPGDHYAQIITREPDPNNCVIGFNGGEKFRFPIPAAEAAALIDGALP